MVKEISLTEGQKMKIWRAIYDNMQPDDRDPHEVISKDYAGEDAYLRAMAEWHHVELL